MALILSRNMREWIRAVLNAVSMITIPAGSLMLPTDATNAYAWILLIVGVGVQYAKYKIVENNK